MVDRFRYLLRFIGTYQVKAHKDLDTGQIPNNKTFEDIYIPCDIGGEIRYTYDTNYELVWVCLGRQNLAKKINKELKKKYNIDYKFEQLGYDNLLWFKESDLDAVAEVIKPSIKHVNRNPFYMEEL